MKASRQLALLFCVIGRVVAQTPTIPSTLDRQQSEAAYVRGLAEDKAGRGDDAVAAYSKAVELDPVNARAWQGRGNDYLAAQDWNKAVTDLEQSVKLAPNEGDSHAALGRAYAHLGRNEEAVAEFTQAISLRLDDQPSYLNRGISRVKLGQYHEAIEDFNYCLRASPASSDALIERAVANGAAGQYRQAADDLTSALKLQPDNLRAFWVRGAIRELLDDLEGAISDYTECIRRNPKDVRFLLARGSVYQRLMKYTLSVEDRDQAVKLAPQNAASYLDRSEAFFSLGKVEEALADQTTAISLAPAAPRTWFSRGNSYFRMGRYSDALADLKEAFRLDPLDDDIQRMMDQARKASSENDRNGRVGKTPQVVAASTEHVPPSAARPVPQPAATPLPRPAPPIAPVQVMEPLASGRGSVPPGAPPALPTTPPAAPHTEQPDPQPARRRPILTWAQLPAFHAEPLQLPAPPQLEFRNFAVSTAVPQSLAPLMIVPAPHRKFVPVLPPVRSAAAPAQPLPPPPHLAWTGITATQNVVALLAKLDSSREIPIRPGGGARVPIAPPQTVAADRARTSRAGEAKKDISTRTAELSDRASEKHLATAFLDSDDAVRFQLPSSPAPAQRSTVSGWQALNRPVKNLLLEGQSLVVHGRYAKAVDVLTNTLKLAPRLPQAFMLRGYAHMRSKQYREAIADFNEAIRLNPSDVDSYICRAFARRSAGDTAGAEADEDKASELVRPSITP